MCAGVSGASLDTRTDSHQDSMKSAGVHLPVQLTLGRRGAMGYGIPVVLQSITSSPLSSSVVQVGTLPKFLDQWRSIRCNRCVLNMVKGHYLQLRYFPPLFYNFEQFNIKVATADDPIIQKEVNELLAKGAIEPSSGVPGFH